MSDELSVWREAQTIYWQSQAFAAITETDDADSENAAVVIRTYGDERHAAGYQAAIADVVEWLREGGRVEAAEMFTRRFGKGQ